MTSQNLLLQDVEFKTTQTRYGVRREFLYENGARYSDYRTHLTILGLPLVAIANGINPETGKRAVAHGVIAIGQLAKGFVAIGQIAYGVIAIGQIAVGLHFALGQFAVAPLVVGQLAVGFIGVGQGGVALAGVFMGGYVDYGYTMTDLF